MASLTYRVDAKMAEGEQNSTIEEFISGQEGKQTKAKRIGVGLTDGEAAQRLWSFLRDYARITKEMAPDKRVDALTDELTWDKEYVRNISDITEIRHIIDLSNATSSKEDTSLDQRNLERMVKSTKAIEAKHGITKSWDMKSTAAEGALHSLVAKLRDNILFQLYRLASQRVFLLEMKKKCAGLKLKDNILFTKKKIC
ncbi:hypothetical protein AC249_AIPGENE13313 [Exaiptasia diaphana]|nr:hypothetical protein AC249_AIPGENE13313 [Exaiptasia diaphana]